MQRDVFYREISALEKGTFFPRSSIILRLTSFLDQNGLLRVGGRLQNSSLPETEKHPIILPENDHVTRLLIQQAHMDTLHAGPAVVKEEVGLRILDS